MRDKYINEILEYQEILGKKIERTFNEDYISEEEQVYEDINSYAYNDFYKWDENGESSWTKKEFKDYILYLEELTGLTNKLGIKK